MKYIKFLFTVVLITSFQVYVSAQDYKDSKVVEGTYNVGKGSTLKLQNQFTSVEVEEWDKNQIQFRADISVETSSKEATEHLMSVVDLKHSQKGDVVTIESGILGKGKSMNTKGKTTFNVKLKIYVPKGTVYDASVKFGNFKVPTLAAGSKTDVQFGSLFVNDVKSNSKISVKFGGLEINRIEQPNVELEFASEKSIVKTISGDANINIRYSNAAIDVNNITGGNISVAFSKVYFVTNNKLSSNVNIVSKFGSVNNNTSLKFEKTEKDKYSQTAEFNHTTNSSKSIKTKSEFSTIYIDNSYPVESFFKGKNKKGEASFSAAMTEVHQYFASNEFKEEMNKIKVQANEVLADLKEAFAASSVSIKEFKATEEKTAEAKEKAAKAKIEAKIAADAAKAKLDSLKMQENY
jgi:hypothetical protein